MLVKSYVYGNNLFFPASAPLSPGSGRTFVTVNSAASVVSKLRVSDLNTIAAVMYVCIIEGLFFSYALTIAPLLSTVLPYTTTTNRMSPVLLYNFRHVCILAVTCWIAASLLSFIIMYLKNIFSISLELRKKLAATEKANEDVSLTFLDSLILADITGYVRFISCMYVCTYVCANSLAQCELFLCMYVCMKE
jgi:hypothetical protein